MRTPCTKAYLPSALAAKLRRLASREQRSASSLIVEAVRLKLANADREEGAQAATVSRLAHLEARIERAVRHGLVIKETLLWFVRVWLEHNPPIEEDLEESAAASASERFERFLGYIADSLNTGRAVASFEPRTTHEDINGATP